MLHKSAIPFTLLLVTLIGALPADAHPRLAGKFPPTPLMMAVTNDRTFEGDIYAIVGSTPVQRTFGERDRPPTVSPLGDYAVYLQVSPSFVKQRSDNDDRSPAQDIYVMNLATFKTTAIATQPNNVSYVDGKARYTLRSNPVWSPDGKLLAWTEIVTDQPAGKNPDLQDERLVVYNLAAKSTSIVVSKLTAHRTIGLHQALSEVSLGPNGLIAVKVATSADLDPLIEDWLYVYDAKGKQLTEIKGLETADPNYESGQLIWLTGFDKPYLSCVVCNTRLDPSTGTSQSLNGTPEVYSALAPDKLSLYYGADSGSEGNVTWVIALNGKQVSKFDSVRIARLGDMAISPDGMQIAGANYAGQGTTAGVYIYQTQSQQITKIKVNVTGLSWGPIAWRVRATQQ